MSSGFNEVRIFVGFQIESEFQTEAEIKAVIALLTEELKKKHHVDLNVKYGIFDPGEILWDEVRESISNCDLAIFDISENNSNVLLEVGLAYGSGKQVFLLKNNASKETYTVPSDLGVIYVRYDRETLAGPQVIKPLVAGFAKYLHAKHPADFYFKRLWGFGEYDSVRIICSELDEPENLQHPEEKEYLYLSKYGDTYALLEVLTTLYRLYPRMDISFISAGEVTPNEDYANNLILVGGPDYNPIAGQFDKYSPFEYFTMEREVDICLRHKQTQTTYVPPETAEGEDGREIIDYGFFLKRRNPHNPDRRLIMIGGCHTYGVYGAVRAFSYSAGGTGVEQQNCKLVIEKLGSDPDFAVLFRVKAIESSVPPPIVNNAEVLEDLSNAGR